MKSFKQYFLIASTALLIGCSTSSPAAAFGDDCKTELPKAQTLEDMIKQADFIGLYTAKKVELVPDMVTGGHYQAQIYAAHFTHAKTLSGDTPLKLKFYITQPELNKTPSYFFHLKDMHQEIADDDNLVMGVGGEVMMPDGTCEFGPGPVITGYQYLIFGGVNSRAAYEPILHRKYDPLYKAVVKKVQGGN